MAQRRMFSKTITNSSRFLMMPQSSQNLYFHLGMNADDDGFCEHFTVMRMTESKPGDLQMLFEKRFVQIFDDRVLVVLDWKENNYIQKDRYTPSKYLEIYKEELKDLSNALLVVIPDGNQMDTSCIHSVSKTDTQVRLGKVRLGKDNKEGAGIPPSLSVWIDYCKSMGYTFNFEAAHAYYETNGWRQARGNKIKDWKACAKTCQMREKDQMGKKKDDLHLDWFKSLMTVK